MKKIKVISTQEQLFKEVLKNYPVIIPDEKGYVNNEIEKVVKEDKNK